MTDLSLALARAIYSRLPIVLLDDVMSGLDSETAANISNRLFGKDGYFRTKNISVVVASNDRESPGGLNLEEEMDSY
jgi:ATP-binding cassette, subfamily C (CFTR/MRP), member 1